MMDSDNLTNEPTQTDLQTEYNNSIEASTLEDYISPSKRQRQQRDQFITELLGLYKENYKNKVHKVSIYKNILFGVCIIGIGLLFISVLTISMKYVFFKDTYVDIVGLLTTLISSSGLLLGLLTIITKYSFPEKEEDAILEMVKAIQNSDHMQQSENNIDRTID